MKIIASDKVKKLFRGYGQGLIKQSDIIAMVDSRQVALGNHLLWTFDQFATLKECKSDVEVVSYVLSLEKKQLSFVKRLFFKENVLNLTVKKYIEILKFVKDGIIDIDKAISNIKQPKMSAEMKAAGFHKLNFGDLGIARTVGEFEHIGTLKAYDLPMHIIIKSLDQIAALKRCEKSHLEIMENKNKSKK